MTKPHRATPWQFTACRYDWSKADTEAMEGDPAFRCILELRARIEALEAAQQPPQDKMDRLIALDRAQPEPVATEGRWSEGVCGDGAAILRDGVMIPIEEVVQALNRTPAEPVAPTDDDLLAMRSWSSHAPIFDSDLVDFGRRCYNLARWGTPANEPDNDEIDEEAAAVISWLLEEAAQAADADQSYAAGKLTLAAQLLGERRPAIQPVAPVWADIHYAWELEDAEGEWQAGGSANSLEDVQREGNRYLQTYAQDGPHKLIIQRHCVNTIEEVANG